MNDKPVHQWSPEDFKVLAKNLEGHIPQVKVTRASKGAIPSVPIPQDDLQEAQEAVSLHGETALDYAKGSRNLKVITAIGAAFAAAATALVGQSSGWASHNLDLAYVLLGGGVVLTAIAALLAALFGTTDPAKGKNPLLNHG